MPTNKKAESYGGGSKGTDFLSTEDGSDTNQNQIETTSPSNGDGQGNVPKGGFVNHPVSPYGEQGHYSDDPEAVSPYNPNKKIPSSGTADVPWGVALVDENHADGGFGTNFVASDMLSLFNLPQKNDENNFLVENDVNGVGNGPQRLDDGLNPSDLTIQPITVNNPTTPSGQADYTFPKENSTVNQDVDDKKSIVQRQTVQAFSFNIIKIKANNIPTQKELINELLSKTQVDDIMYPDEVRYKHNKSTHDFSNEENQYANNGTMLEAPNLDSDNSETSLYSGFSNANKKNKKRDLLSFYKQKCVKCGSSENDMRGKICDKCAFDKEAFNVAIMPSSNPNSGQDSVEHTYSGGTYPVMSDGKGAGDTLNNEQDKLFNDPSEYRKQKIKYKTVEDTDNYYNLSGNTSGAGYGMEGDGVNQSGIDTAN